MAIFAHPMVWLSYCSIGSMSFNTRYCRPSILTTWRCEEKRKQAIDLHEVGDYPNSSYESTSLDLAGAIAGPFLKSESSVLANQEPTGSAERNGGSLGFDLALAWFPWHFAIDRRVFLWRQQWWHYMNT